MKKVPGKEEINKEIEAKEDYLFEEGLSNEIETDQEDPNDSVEWIYSN